MSRKYRLHSALAEACDLASAGSHELVGIERQSFVGMLGYHQSNTEMAFTAESVFSSEV